MGDGQRGAILARRALFVSSALGAAACSGPKAPPAVTSSTPVMSVPTGGGDATVFPVPSSAPSMSPTGPTKLPPLAVPDDVSEAARPHFERLAAQIPAIHARLDASTPPRDCPIGKQACEARWRELAKAVVEIDDMVASLSPRCQGSSADAQRFDARLEAHRTVLRERRQTLVAAAADAARWAELYEQAEQAFPRVCLKYSCSDW